MPLSDVGEEVDLLEPRTIAEMEARDRIGRQTTCVTRMQEIPRRRPPQRLLDRLAGLVELPPAFGIEIGRARRGPPASARAAESD